MPCMFYYINNLLWVNSSKMKAIQHFLFLAQSSHDQTAPRTPVSFYVSPFFFLLFFSSSLGSSITLSNFVRNSMNGVDSPQCLPCSTDTPRIWLEPQQRQKTCQECKEWPQWLIRRKFPAKDWTEGLETTSARTFMGEMSGMTTDSVRGGMRQEDRTQTFDTKKISAVRAATWG